MKRLIALLVFTFALGTAYAQSYPTKPIHFITGFSAGGGTDTTMRIIAPVLSELLGQSVLVENRPGGAANIAAEYVAKSAPDGYTILLYVDGYTIAPWLFSNLRYDPVKDFIPITNLVTGAHILAAHPSLQQNTLAEIAEYAKLNPRKLKYASPGVGQPQHLAMELFKSMAGGLEIVHVPYKGGSKALLDVLPGRVPLTMQGFGILSRHIKAGALKPIAVTTKARFPALPNVPTFDESGFGGFETTQWWGPAVPAGTPEPIVRRLHSAFLKALRNPKVVERYSKMGFEAAPSSSPEAFAMFIKAEMAKWRPVVAKSGAKITD